MNELLANVGRHSALVDECYVQLIKQTTSNKSDRPDGPMRVWRLLSIVTAYVDCSDTLRPYLMKYLTVCTEIRHSYAITGVLVGLAPHVPRDGRRLPAEHAQDAKVRRA